MDNTWSKINDYNKLRNIFVHGDGLVSRKTAIDLAKRNEGLLIALIDIDKIAIRFSKEFNLKVLETIESFYNILEKAMQNIKSEN